MPRGRVTCICQFCEKPFEVMHSRKKPFCSGKCYHAARFIPLDVQFARGVEGVLPTEKGCIEWNGLRNAGRWKYGFIYSNTRPPQRLFQAHRLAWEFAHGPIPDGVQVLHSCDNPPCVNVEHLFLGTQMDNIQDMIKKKRDDNRHRRISDTIRKQIRKLYAAGGVSQQTLADKFHMHQGTVSSIVRS